MKKPTVLFLPAGALSLLASCSSINRLTRNAAEPAPVFVSSTIQRIGIVNRTAPSEAHKTIDKMDQIHSLEGFKLDKLGADNAVKASLMNLRQMAVLMKWLSRKAIPWIGKGWVFLRPP